MCRVWRPDRPDALGSLRSATNRRPEPHRWPSQSLCPLSNIFFLCFQKTSHRFVQRQIHPGPRSVPYRSSASVSGEIAVFAAHIFFFVFVQMRPAPIQPVGFVGFVIITRFRILHSDVPERPPSCPRSRLLGSDHLSPAVRYTATAWFCAS